MKKHWWKVLSVLIMLYVLIAGFLVPLKPGVYNYSPTNITIGDSESENTIIVNTYNTYLKSAKETNVWLKLPNEKLIKATKLNISSENQVAASFDIPYALEDFEVNEDALTLIVDNEIDGYAFYPEAIRVKSGDAAIDGSNTYLPLSVIKEVENFRFPWRPINMDGEGFIAPRIMLAQGPGSARTGYKVRSLVCISDDGGFGLWYRRDSDG